MDHVSALKDFTKVRLVRGVEEDGIYMPQGARGIVMAAYADGLAYEVEFEEPHHVVMTVEWQDIEE